jgi:hypothetical protein
VAVEGATAVVTAAAGRRRAAAGALGVDQGPLSGRVAREEPAVVLETAS